MHRRTHCHNKAPTHNMTSHASTIHTAAVNIHKDHISIKTDLDWKSRNTGGKDEGNPQYRRQRRRNTDQEQVRR